MCVVTMMIYIDIPIYRSRWRKIVLVSLASACKLDWLEERAPSYPTVFICLFILCLMYKMR